MSTIRFRCFPQTQPPPSFIDSIVGVFRNQEPRVSTIALAKGLESNAVLAVVRGELAALGFAVESGKQAAQKIARPVFFGESGKPTLNYQIDCVSR